MYRPSTAKQVLVASALALTLAACNDQYAASRKSLSPIPPQTMALMAAKNMEKADPILVRLYKKESELELWKKGRDGKYAVLKTFPICRWSGQLGPKSREGDRQAPEGFYNISPGQMNPNSAYYLSFDTGYPNSFDKSHGRTGSQLMVHGDCSSRGCYAMTDDGISEVYALAREAFAGGQRGFQFQAYPFRMTAENLARHRSDPNIAFWKNLKEGSDHFEITGREPKVAVCAGRYAFDTVGTGCTPDPTLAAAVAEKEDQDRRAVAELVAKGTPAVKLVYADGGQHESFRSTALAMAGDAGGNYSILDARPTRRLGDVSRPDALAQGPREILVEPNGKPTQDATIAVAAAEPKPARPASTLARMTVARAAEPAPVAAAPAEVEAAPSQSRSFYERMLGVLGTPATTPDPVTAEIQVPAESVPMPPRRGVASTAKAAPAKIAPKPQAAAPGPQRNVDAGTGPARALAFLNRD